MSELCEKHKIAKYYDDCDRCNGNGYTDFDIEEMDNPISFHSNGDCYVCKGSGRAPYKSCELCEEEAREAMELEYETF